MSENKLRPKYHKRSNRDGTKSVALPPESYEKLREKSEELDVTIKSLLAVLIERYVDQIVETDSEPERVGF